MRFIWYSDTAGFVLLPPPKVDLVDMARQVDRAVYRFSLDRWSTRRAHDGCIVTAYFPGVDWQELKSSWYIPWRFDSATARSWVQQPTQDASIDIMVPIGPAIFIGKPTIGFRVNSTLNALFLMRSGKRFVGMGRVQVWDLSTGQKTKTLRPVPASGSPPRAINSCEATEEKVVSILGTMFTQPRFDFYVGVWDYSEAAATAAEASLASRQSRKM